MSKAKTEGGVVFLHMHEKIERLRGTADIFQKFYSLKHLEAGKWKYSDRIVNYSNRTFILKTTISKQVIHVIESIFLPVQYFPHHCAKYSVRYQSLKVNFIPSCMHH